MRQPLSTKTDRLASTIQAQLRVTTNRQQRFELERTYGTTIERIFLGRVLPEFEPCDFDLHETHASMRWIYRGAGIQVQYGLAWGKEVYLEVYCPGFKPGPGWNRIASGAYRAANALRDVDESVWEAPFQFCGSPVLWEADSIIQGHCWDVPAIARSPRRRRRDIEGRVVDKLAMGCTWTPLTEFPDWAIRRTVA